MLVKNIFLGAIQLYQIYISPLLGKNCRFWPSCSEYTSQAIKKYGLLSGGSKGLKRIISCHPWHQGGIDALN